MKALEEQDRSMSWLANELDRTLEGFKLSLKNETIKYSDFKKMSAALKKPIQYFFEGTTVQKIKGDNNVQAHNSMVAEPEVKYKVDSLESQVVQLKSQLADKERIIELLSKK